MHVQRFAMAGALAASACAAPISPGRVDTPPPGPTKVVVSDTEIDLAGSADNATAVRLGDLVHYVATFAGASDSLPSSLESVIENQPRIVRLATDVWGRVVRYTPTGSTFELRSAGRDGAFDTPDDVWSVGRSGRSVPCVTYVGDRRIEYTHAAPPCPDEARRSLPALR